MTPGLSRERIPRPSASGWVGRVRGPVPVGLAVIALVLLAAAFRLYFVRMPFTDWFNWREASTAMMAGNLPGNGWSPLWPQVDWTGDQPGYQGREFQVLTFFAAALDVLLGRADWHGRAVATAFGLLSVIALNRLCTLIHGRIPALFITLVFAILPGVIAIDSSYLPDPAMLALALVSLWLLAVGLRDGRRVLLLGAASLGTLAILAKLPAVAVLPAGGYLAATLGAPEQRSRRLAFFAAWVLVAAVPVGAYYLWAIHLGRTYPPYHIAGQGNIWDLGFRAFLRDRFYLPSLYRTATEWLWMPPFLLLAVLGALPVLDEGDGRRPTGSKWFFHVWAAGCLVFYMATARELTSNPHNLHVFNPCIAAFAGIGLMRFCLLGSAVTKSPAMATTRGVMALGLLLGGTYAGLKDIMRSNYAVIDHGLGSSLAELAKDESLVVIAGAEAGNPLPIYYSGHRGWLFPPAPQHESYTLSENEMIATFEDLRRRGARWFAYAKAAHDYDEPRRYFVTTYPKVLQHITTYAVLAAETSDYVIFRLPEPTGEPTGAGRP